MMITTILYYGWHILSFILFFCVAKVIYRYLTNHDIPNIIYCSNTPENQQKLKQIPQLKSFRSSPLLFNGNLQSMFFQLFRSYPHNKQMVYERDFLKLDDGGQIILDWTVKDFHKNTPTVILCHGVCGGSQCDYIQWQIEECVKKGFRCVVMNQRGCNDNYLQTPRTFTAVSTVEIRTSVNYIKSVLPKDTSLHAIGFSLGTNYLALYVGEEGNNCPFQSVILQSPPMYAFQKYHEDNTLEGKFYTRVVCENLKMLLNRSEAMKEYENYNEYCEAHTISELDEVLFAPISGLTVEEYRRRADMYKDLLSCPCPMLVLSSLQDPCCYPYRIIDSQKEIESTNPNLMVIITQEGGHLAWGTGFWPKDSSWSDQVTANWLTYHTSLTAVN